MVKIMFLRLRPHMTIRREFICRHPKLRVNPLNDFRIMTLYETHTLAELAVWQRRMQQAPSFVGQLAKRWQNRVNQWIPEKVHKAITLSIRQTSRAVFFGAGFTTRPPV
jgi:hypothetical protein